MPELAPAGAHVALWLWAISKTAPANPGAHGGSLGHTGFPGFLFHSNNLPVCGSHTPNFNLSVTDDLLLKCLVIN